MNVNWIGVKKECLIIGGWVKILRYESFCVDGYLYEIGLFLFYVLYIFLYFLYFKIYMCVYFIIIFIKLWMNWLKVKKGNYCM